MSFFRPEAVRALRRWAEPVAALVISVVLAGVATRHLGDGEVTGWLALAALLPVLLWLRAAVGTALAAGQVPAAGVVVIRENEIGYLGPERGGFIALDDLEEVRVEPAGPGREPAWRLRAGMAELVIPAGAEGADLLLGELTALPGFPDIEAAAALAGAANGPRLVWRRPAAALIRPG